MPEGHQFHEDILESAEMSALASKYAIPAELDSFIDSGFLTVLAEKPGEKTVEFHIPQLRYEDENGIVSAFSLIWIHPAFNSQFCHYYDKTPGDIANFYLSKETMGSADESIDLESLDDLIAWLAEKSDRR